MKKFYIPGARSGSKLFSKQMILVGNELMMRLIPVISEGILSSVTDICLAYVSSRKGMISMCVVNPGFSLAVPWVCLQFVVFPDHTHNF